MAATLGTYRTQLLWDAISKGDLTAVINLLENKSINLEERDENGVQPLEIKSTAQKQFKMAATLGTYRTQLLWDAISKGDLTAVINLLENKSINLEERGENGQTFLMVACQQGEISMVRELLEAGMDPNAVDNDRWTALLYAAKDGHLEICIELLERHADIEHRDMCNWSALMWASYNGQVNVVTELLDRGSDPNIKAEHNMSCLGWAAGRGHEGVVEALLEKQAKVNSTDRFGTTPLIWACRKGHLKIVQMLLDHGASADNTGMDSLTALLVATKGGYTEVVQALLEFDPNVNALDKDGFTALTIAAKEGYEDIAQDLLAKDAYVNITDRAGDTILIHAVKGGYTNIVRALLNRYADVDVEGSERKTALYWAVEKDHKDIVKLLLDNDADMEICTKDGDTPLMRAVRNRHEMIVRMLLDKGARVSIMDKKGDTALHISLRARSKRITELLLRNPRNSRLLYLPNKAGETPYSIDAYSQKGIIPQIHGHSFCNISSMGRPLYLPNKAGEMPYSIEAYRIIPQIHGHRQLNTSDGENLLGYEIYSSSLADILSEPSLNTPITVGLYAKWGSGKSFLLGKLQNEMKAFTKANEENQLTFTWSLFIILLIFNSIVGSVLALVVLWEVGIGVGFGLFLIEYGFFGMVWVGTAKYNVKFARGISNSIGKRLHIVSLLLKVLFCNPIKKSSSTTDVPLVKFLFSKSTKLTSVGGEKALAAIVAGLSESVEKEFGVFSARLFGVFKHSYDKPHIGRFKTICCIPVFMIVVFILICFISGIALLVTFNISNHKVVDGFMATFAGIVGLAIVFNIPTFWRALIALFVSQKRRIMKAADNIHSLKVEGFMQILKHEVMMMNVFVTSLDKFTRNTTRLVVVVDGLDSCEQEKVLQVLDIIHALFNDDNSPFVVILAVDPQIIIKGIDQNLKSGFQDTTVNGFDYLRNIVHLPFYLQSQGLQVKRQQMIKSNSTTDVGHESPTHGKNYRHQDSTVSQISGFTMFDPGNKKKGQGQPTVDSFAQVAHSNFDISHTLTKNDYFSDINPKSMRRLMNIVAVTGRLLRAYNIDFNWYRLAAWVNLVEQWPYRLSWIVLTFEEKDDLDETITLKNIFEKIEAEIPESSEIEPLLEIDRNVRKFQAFLASKASHSPMLNVGDLKKFLPCTINLDPYLRKLIRNMKKSMTQPDLQRALFPPAAVSSSGSTFDQPKINQTAFRPGFNKQGKNPSMPPFQMNPYGPMGMMHPQMMGVSPYMMGMANFGPYGGVPDMGQYGQPRVPSKPSNPGQFIQGFCEKDILIKMDTTKVCSLLSRIEGINILQLPKYQQTIEENNINGMVLSQCDLEQLKDCLQMKFGDWQLFRSAVQELREAELELDTREQTDEANSRISQAESDTSNSHRSIKFSDVDDDIEPEDMRTMYARSQKSSLSRQKSMDINRATDTVNSASKFDAIQEMDENMMEVSREKSMARNDSVVAELMYETGLLQEFIHGFAEDLDEEEDTFLPNGDLMDVHQNPATSFTSGQSDTRFSISSSQSDDFNDQYQNSEMDPLLSEETPLKTVTVQVSKNPTPILKMPKKVSKNEKNSGNESGKSDSELPGHVDDISGTREKRPSIPSERTSLSVINETAQESSHGQQSSIAGQSSRSYQGQSSPPGHSLRESVEEFTMQDVSSRKSNKDGVRFENPFP